MNNKNEVNFLTECDICKEKFGVKKEQITFKKKYDVSGQSIYLTYFDCPSCGKRYFVQIDDAKTIKLLNEASEQFSRLAALKTKGKEIDKDLSAKFSKTRKHLGSSRNKLMKQYTGKLVHDNDSDKDFKLMFTVMK